jgi:type I restriction enzyme S subunit
MNISRVKPGSIETSRLDPDYYNPIYLEDVVKLKDFGSIELSTAGKFFTGTFGSKLPSNLYLDEGIPLFRVGNIGKMEVLKENLAYLDKYVHEELKSSEVRSGDVLIVKASVGEKICKLPDWVPKANITQHIIGLRSNDRFDMDYVCSFL